MRNKGPGKKVVTFKEEITDQDDLLCREKGIRVFVGSQVWNLSYWGSCGSTPCAEKFRAGSGCDKR